MEIQGWEWGINQVSWEMPYIHTAKKRCDSESWIFESMEKLNYRMLIWGWSWNSKTLTTWCKELTHWKRPRCWERLKTGGEGDDRGWDGWMASLTQWTWVWVSSESWQWTGEPGVLQSKGSQKVRHDWVTELNRISLETACKALVLYDIIKTQSVDREEIGPGTEA